MEGGREGEVVLRVWVNAVATEGMLGDLNPLGDVRGFYSEVVLQKRESEGTVRTKHQLNLAPNPGGTHKTLDNRRYGCREEQRIPHVGGGAGAAQGVTGHLRALGDRTGCTVTNDGASVPEVLTPAKLESVLAVVVVGGETFITELGEGRKRPPSA